MFAPKVFTENVFDDWFEDFGRGFRDIDRKLYGRHAGREMLTDVREHEGHYELEIDLPGFKKDQITLELKDGYLTVTASKGLDRDSHDKKGRLLRQERYAGVMQRSFRIGDEVAPEEVHAKFEDGVLRIEVPKKEETPKIPEKSSITIE